MREDMRLDGHAAGELEVTGCRKGLFLDQNVEQVRRQGAPRHDHHHPALQRQRIGKHEVVFARFQRRRVDQTRGMLTYLA